VLARQRRFGDCFGMEKECNEEEIVPPFFDRFHSSAENFGPPATWIERRLSTRFGAGQSMG
jgi:hypothetical protein